MTSPLFKGSREDFSMDYCANCGTYLSGVKLRVEIEGQEVKVCSFACEKELKSKTRNSSQKFIFSDGSLSKDEK